MSRKDGFSWYRATGWSMFPFIREQDFILVKNASPESIKKGDTILFECEKSKVCHMVTGVQKTGENLFFLTRGYSKTRHCDKVPAQMFIGKIVSIKRGERIINITGGRFCRAYLTLGCVLADCGYAAGDLLSRISPVKKLYRLIFSK